MRADIYPLQVLLATLAGWLNRHQQDVIAYLVEENRVLESVFGSTTVNAAAWRPRPSGSGGKR